MLTQPKVKKLLSSDHFFVDRALIDDCASMKNVERKNDSDGPPAQGGWRNTGQKRSNDTHASTSDRDAGLCRKDRGKETRLAVFHRTWAD